MSRNKGVAEQVIRDIRAGWRALVRDMGGVDATSKVAQTTISQVSIYGNPNGDSLPSLATVLAVEMDLGVGFAHVTEAMARATDHVLVPVKPLSHGELATLLARLGAETGEVFARFAAAQADGRICAEDRAAMIREVEDVVQAGHCLLGHLRQPPQALAAAEERAA